MNKIMDNKTTLTWKDKIYMFIGKSRRWKFPTISYTNFKKEYPNMGGSCFTRWFSFNRMWSGKIWNFYVKHYQISLDFRQCWIRDMMFPNE